MSDDEMHKIAGAEESGNAGSLEWLGLMMSEQLVGPPIVE